MTEKIASIRLDLLRIDPETRGKEEETTVNERKNVKDGPCPLHLVRLSYPEPQTARVSPMFWEEVGVEAGTEEEEGEGEVVDRDLAGRGLVPTPGHPQEEEEVVMAVMVVVM